ncbi:MAG TPA: glycerol kinase GlpK [Acidimicrobiales bacterium]|nr:glycerol kinase GlpK [Acidimicrobiales bacterium]
MPGLVLAIDQGTTGTTVLAVRDDGSVAGQAYAAHRQHFPGPGLVEHDASEIWSNVVQLLGKALDTSGLGYGDVAAIGITNQRETTLVWERSSGELVAPAIVWQDRRSTAICRRLAAEGAGDLVTQRSGLVLDPYFSATKLAWIFEESPGLRRRAEAGELCFGTVDSFLVWQLSGGARHVTDVTNASRTLLMDLERLAYDDELCALFGVPPAVLPEIVDSIGEIAETAPGVLPRSGIPVSGILGDQQAALFAQGCRRPGQAKNTYGTGSFVLANTGSSRPSTATRLLATAAVAEAGAAAQYALEGAIFATGSAVQWLRDGLGIIGAASESEALAASLASNDGVYFVPALAGLGAPFWDPLARGTLLGATHGTTRAHLARAVLESIAYRTRDVLEAMGGAGVPVEELRVDGGASDNAWLMQFQADVAGIPVDVAAVRETTSLGAAYAAGLGAGIWDDREELASLRRSAGVFEPRRSRDEADALYDRWLEALGRARGWARA